MPNLLLVPLLAAAGMQPATAQCSNVLLPGDGLPGFNGAVMASCTWDPDGAGPLGPHLVFGGSFTLAGNIEASGIVAWDPTTGIWLPIGAGLAGQVSSLFVRANGELIAGGQFSGLIARWTGATWQTLGTGMHPGISPAPGVFSLAEMPNGDLVAGGSFFSAGGVIANNIASWNGSSWSALATGVLGLPVLFSAAGVRAMVVLGNGDLVVTGSFVTAGGVAAANVARWNGSTWSAIGAGADSTGFALHVLPGGDLLVGGFAAIGGTLMTRWDGTQWLPFGPVLGSGFVWTIATAANGDLIVGGQFAFGTSQNLAQWNGSSWSGLGSGIGGTLGFVATLPQLPSGDLVAAGTFRQFGQNQQTNAARWNGTAWAPIAAGFDGVLRAVERLPNDHFVAAGFFSIAGDSYAASIAEWNGTSWQPLGSGLDGITNDQQGAVCLATLANGDLVVGGTFATAGGVSVANIARWDGASWSPLGGGVGDSTSRINAVTVLANGDLIVGGWFDSASGVSAANIARWNGSTWSALGSGTDGGVYAIAELPNGDLVATGTFSTAGGVPARVARWHGATWTAIGALPQGAGLCLLVEPNGELMLGGSFVSGGAYIQPVWHWDGAVWSPVGPVMQNSPYAVEAWALTRHASGDLIAAGSFGTAGGISTNNLARWNGSSWSALAGGTDGAVNDVMQLANGEVVACGQFRRVSGQIRPFLARIGTTCPALATPLGTTCTSPNGPMLLTANTLPWLGSTFTATCTGLDPAALAFSLFGFTSLGTPLSALHPAGDPGCSLWASPDVVWYQPAIGGIAPSSLPIPNALVFVGATLTHQLLEIEFGAGASLTRIGGSNGLTLTLGAF